MVITEAGNVPKSSRASLSACLNSKWRSEFIGCDRGYPSAGGDWGTREEAAGFVTVSLKGIKDNFVQDLPAADREMKLRHTRALRKNVPYTKNK
jgi:hypothetical protein